MGELDVTATFPDGRRAVLVTMPHGCTCALVAELLESVGSGLAELLGIGFLAASRRGTSEG